jgi:hypothetical protein
VLSEANDDDYDCYGNESCSDFEPEIAGKIKKTVHHFCIDSESESAKQLDG